MTDHSTNNLRKWVKVNAEIKINLVANPISLKNIAKIGVNILSMGENETDIQSLTRHLIFVSRTYLPTASRTVKIYKDLVEKRLLPEDWGNIHLEYYSSSLLEFFTKRKKDERSRKVFVEINITEKGDRETSSHILIPENNDIETSDLNLTDALKTLSIIS